METPRLSKSRVQAGAQCELRLWYEINARELAAQRSEEQQYFLDRGRTIGELARQRYPGGHRIEADYRQTELALDQTATELARTPQPILFEPAFAHRKVLVRVDVLRPAESGSFDLLEVKSATKAKEVYRQDVAIQEWILRGAGLPLRKAGLLLLNRDYAFDGRELDLSQLFRFEDLSAETRDRQEEVEALVGELQAMLRRPEPPEIEPGPHCHDPYACPFFAHCSADLPPLEHPISQLPGFRVDRQLALHEMGVEAIADVPDDFPLNPLQKRVRACVQNQREWLGDRLREALDGVSYPVHHLDFEAFMPAIPLCEGTHPFDTLPFQYSIHRQSAAGAIEHLEHLCRDGADPRRPLAEQLLVDLSDEGSICVYSSYEKRIISLLAAAFPDMAGPLLALKARLWDLLPILRAHYYHPDFHGSFSIKSVLPVLVPGLSYDDLEIADGLAAARMYEATLAEDDEERRQEIFASLLRYCSRDTEAMVRLRAALAEKAESR